jgi:hypothetical protein
MNGTVGTFMLMEFTMCLQVLLDDPDIPGFQPALPDGFDVEKLAKEVEEEQKSKRT